jgi:hypothetical protein
MPSAGPAKMDIEPEAILGIVRQNKYASSLLHNERNERMVDTSGTFYFRTERGEKKGQYVPLSGLMPSLRAAYWPHSNIYQQMKNSLKLTATKGGKQRKAASRPHSKPSQSKPAQRGKYAGVIKGSQVHQQMRDLVVLDKKNFKKTHRDGMHDFTARLMKVIVERQRWTPFLPEHPVFDEDLGMGTRVDLICVDQSGSLVLLEFKTGYKKYFEGADGHMQRALSALSNTVKNQATLQIVVAALILQRKYGIPVRAMQMAVMRIDDETIDLLRVPSSFLSKMGDAIYSDLLEFRQINR